MISRLSFVLFSLMLVLQGCGQVIQQQQLPESPTTVAQQEIDIDYVALTLPVANKLNLQPFERLVSQSGTGRSARVVSEGHLMHVHALPTTSPVPYRIGVGDTLGLLWFRATSNQVVSDQASETVVQRSAKVNQDGSALFIETGPINVEGKTLAEARNEFTDAFTRNGIPPQFQLEIIEFGSQKVSVTTLVNAGNGEEGPGANSGSGTYPITERPMSLRELLVDTGLQVNYDEVQLVSVIRNKRRYKMPVAHIMAPGSPDYYLTGGDTVQLDSFPYRKGKALLVTGDGVTASLEVSPSERPTLSDLLLSDGGELFAQKKSNTQRIYVLRGTNPMMAYHLDALDPSRLRIATELELRPDDIVFVSAKPLYTIAEVVSALNPLATIQAAVQ